jgi:hypothetical protein
MSISLPEQSPQQRRTARIAGWLMASTFLTSIPAALILYDPVLNDTNYILGAGDDTRVTLGAIFMTSASARRRGVPTPQRRGSRIPRADRDSAP